MDATKLPEYDCYGVKFQRTPNPDCPACWLKRQHTQPELKRFHPLAGTGKVTDRRLAGGQ